MRITQLDIEGFGIFCNVQVRDMESKVTVFEGQNEAGKTTLMSYIRAILFGFDNRRQGINRYEPVRGGRHGGALVVETEEGKRFRIERVDTGPRSRVKVQAVPSTPSGTPPTPSPRTDEDLLQSLLHNTSKVLYQNVFAFGIGELERLDTLQAEEVSNHIYTVGMGTGLNSLTSVQAGLEGEQGLLFKPGGRKPVINQLLQSLDETQSTIRELQVLPDEYLGLGDRLIVLNREIEEFQSQLEEAKSKRDWLESLVKARTDWEQLQVVRAEMQDVPVIESFPAGGIERLEQLERSWDSLTTRLDEVRSAIQKTESRKTQVRVDDMILRYQTDIDGLEELRGRHKGLMDSLSDLRSRVVVRRKVLDDMMSRLGPTWTDERLDGFEASIPMRERIRSFRDRLEQSKQDVLDAGRTLQDVQRLRKGKEAELEQLQEKLDQCMTPDIAERVPLEDREQGLRQWIQLTHSLELTRQHRQDLKGQADALKDQIVTSQTELTVAESQRGLPIWALLMLSIVFAGPAVFSGLRHDMFLTVMFATAGIVTVGLLTWWRHDFMTQRKGRVLELQDQCHTLLSQYEEIQTEGKRAQSEEAAYAQEHETVSRDILGLNLDSIESAESVRRALEAERRVVERREDINARIQDEEEALVRVLEKHEAALKSRQSVEQGQEEALDDWKALLSTLGLPKELTPDGALEVIAGVERAQGQLREWREALQEMQHVEQAVDDMVSRLNQVLQQCGWSSVAVEESPTALLSLRKALAQSQASQQELSRIEDVLSEKRAELEAGESEQARFADQLKALLSAGGAGDPESFRRRAVLYQRQNELERQSRQLDIALKVHAGSIDRYHDMERIFQKKSRAELERELQEVKVEGHQRLGEVLAKKLQENGRVEQQIQDLEHNERLSSVMLDRQTLLSQLDQQSQRWAIRTICQHFLDKARQVYERERQPAILREASKFFAIMTNNRYMRIIVPLGEMRLAVETDKGTFRPTDVLSRGTAEQLYLAMRLAFIREYAQHAGPLPIVIDDILVNFDPGRAKATIKVLGVLAATHQVLVFTCHPHVRRWFEETLEGVSIRSIPKSA